MWRRMWPPLSLPASASTKRSIDSKTSDKRDATGTNGGTMRSSTHSIIIERLQRSDETSRSGLLLFPLERAHHLRQLHVRQQSNPVGDIEGDPVEPPVEAVARDQESVSRDAAKPQPELVDLCLALLCRPLRFKRQRLLDYWRLALTLQCGHEVKNPGSRILQLTPVASIEGRVFAQLHQRRADMHVVPIERGEKLVERAVQVGIAFNDLFDMRPRQPLVHARRSPQTVVPASIRAIRKRLVKGLLVPEQLRELRHEPLNRQNDAREHS